MSSNPWFVFAGGGTGGHLFPALAVVESLRASGSPVDVSFFCTQRPIDRDILGTAGIDAVPQVVQPVPPKPWHWPGFLLQWRQSVGACRRRFTQRRPAAVIGAGGYASGPPVHTAIRMGIPTFLLNPDAVPGKANQHMGRGGRVAGIFAQWPVTVQHFPAGAPVLVTGCPVREAFRHVAQQANTQRASVLESFGLEPGRRTLLVTGASQGARTVNEAMLRLADAVAAAGWQILHLSGAADRGRVETAYAAVRPQLTQHLGYRVLDFTARMAEAMAACDLIVSRAGASSLAEILAVGRPSILLPYPYHKDRHQWHNGQVLVDAGAAVMLDDHKDPVANERELRPVLTALMQDDERREAMRQAAQGLDRPDAGPTIAALLRVMNDLPAGSLITRSRAEDGGRAIRIETRPNRGSGHTVFCALDQARARISLAGSSEKRVET